LARRPALADFKDSLEKLSEKNIDLSWWSKIFLSAELAEFTP